MTDKDRYLRTLKKELKGPKKEIKKMLADISSDIDNNIGDHAKYDEIENSIGNIDFLIKGFNNNYLIYMSKRKKKKLRICTIILGCAGVLLGLIGQLGKIVYMNGRNIAKTGGSDGPMQVIQEFEPYTFLDLFDLFTKISVPILLIFIIMIIITIKRRE